jgi:hypothetical protein
VFEVAQQNAMTRSLERLPFSGRNEAALGAFKTKGEGYEEICAHRRHIH